MPGTPPGIQLPAPARPAELPANLRDQSAYAVIAAGNVFSQTRTAPKVRFVPEGRSEPAPAVAAKQRPRQATLRLFGITAGPQGSIALIDADPKIIGAELYRVGDRVGGGSITSISDSTVIISRPGGTLVLRLPVSLKSRR
jgi:hypothetical protein